MPRVHTVSVLGLTVTLSSVLQEHTLTVESEAGGGVVELAGDGELVTLCEALHEMCVRRGWPAEGATVLRMVDD